MNKFPSFIVITSFMVFSYFLWLCWVLFKRTLLWIEFSDLCFVIESLRDFSWIFPRYFSRFLDDRKGLDTMLNARSKHLIKYICKQCFAISTIMIWLRRFSVSSLSSVFDYRSKLSRQRITRRQTSNRK